MGFSSILRRWPLLVARTASRSSSDPKPLSQMELRMITRFMQAIHGAVRLATVAAALAISSPAAYAQQPPAATIASATELIKVTGATTLFNPLIAGVIEQAKSLYLQQNPGLAKDLN